MDHYICIHAHFYQPPRENPWLEAIELQDSAYPYHDWNERVMAQCYAANATSRILDPEGWIVEMVNNYSKISFNFGPTLLTWLENQAPEVYAQIVKADRESQEIFGGHGSAIAQAYNHMILPLANRRDKYTQVLWGVRDFMHRFGRQPEGMWLPETAVDLESLDIMAELGIRFTILEPHQAGRVRAIESGEWEDVSGGHIDPTMPYRLSLPSGRDMSIFFYDGPISRAVAFEGLLNNGQTFAERLLEGFSDERNRPQLVHIATDGESYGHHHRFGDMALAYALHQLESQDLATLTNYGQFLEIYPPTHEVEIVENTSWSCSHGIERWRSDCGCNSGAHPDWHQQWRRPLREALDRLRDTVSPLFAEKAGSLLTDPWKTRDEYIRVLLDRSPENRDQFLAQQSGRDLSAPEKITVLKLMELQRHCMLMYTSCGWFFDEISGIETVQILEYAGRVIQLAEELFGDQIDGPFLDILAGAESNIPQHGDGRRIYEKFVRPAWVDLKKVCAHYAASSLFEAYGETTQIFCYHTERKDYRVSEAGRAKLAVGETVITSEITLESDTLGFGVLHWGDHNLSCGVQSMSRDEPFAAFCEQAEEAFVRADFAETSQILERHFETQLYNLGDLFRDEQRMILDIILESSLTDAGAVYHQIYEHNAPLLRFLKSSGVPAPKSLYMAAEFALNLNLRKVFQEPLFDVETAKNLLQEAELEGVTLDERTLEISVRRSIEQLTQQLGSNPKDLDLVQSLNSALQILDALPFEVNLRKIQDIFYGIYRSLYPDMKAGSDGGDPEAREWLDHFLVLGRKLSITVE